MTLTLITNQRKSARNGLGKERKMRQMVNKLPMPYKDYRNFFKELNRHQKRPDGFSRP